MGHVAGQVCADLPQGKHPCQVIPLALFQVIETVVTYRNRRDLSIIIMLPCCGSGRCIHICHLAIFSLITCDQRSVQVQDVQFPPPAPDMGAGGIVLSQCRVIDPDMLHKCTVRAEYLKAFFNVIFMSFLQHGKVCFLIFFPVPATGFQKGIKRDVIPHVLVSGHHKNILLYVKSHC